MDPRLLDRLLDGRDLDAAQAEALLDAVMEGSLGETRLAALLAALRAKGETEDEITGFARSLRRHAVRVAQAPVGAIDTCGTGGDGSGNFNISTATALVAAAMGIPVAKHGNRAVSSRCGSADVLEALGVAVDLPPERAAVLVERVGIGFLFAPLHHPALRQASVVRRELGVRTVFNLLGPLANPAGVRRQLLGVYAPGLVPKMARALRRLGAERAFVVHGDDGSDEVSLTGPTAIAELRGGVVRATVFVPEKAGLARCDPADLAGGDAQLNAELVRGVLAGEPGPRRDAVLLNAGFCAVLAGRAADPAQGVALARRAVVSGDALATLERLAEASQKLAREAS